MDQNTVSKRTNFSKGQLVAFIITFGLVGSYFIYRSLAVASPTPVPAANVNGVTVGPGFVRSSTRQIIRTAGHVVYIFAVDDNVCQGGGSAVLRAYKGSGAQTGDSNVPTSFAEVDSANHPVSAGSGDCTSLATSMLEDPDVKLDPSGIAHLAYIDEKTGDVYYQTFNTNTDTWGTRTVLATNGSTTSGASWPRTGQTGLTLDSNNVPWVVYATSGSSNAISYTDMLGGSWSAPATIFAGTNEMHPSIATSTDGTLHLAWLDNSLATHGVIKYAHYSGGVWGTVETVSSGDSIVLANGDDDQGPTVAVDTSNRPHVLYMDGTVNGNDNYVRLRYRTTGGTWTDNTPPGGAGGASNASGTWYAHTPGNYVSNANDDYVFLGHDVNIEFGYQYQIGGPGNNWGAYTTLDPRSKTNPAPGDTCEPGQDGAASVRFDPLRDNNPGIIDVAYYDERDTTDCTHHHADIFYKAIDIPVASGDTTPPTVSISSPTNNATVSGSTTVSATASDNVAVASVQFKIDGTNLGAADTTSPYSINWDTTTVTNSSHALTAVACDTSSNCTTSSAVTVTVNNPDNTPPTVSLTAPTDGATVSGSSVTVSANASDNVGVAGVQFKLDGANLGAEDTTSPYSITWDSTTAPNGSHTLSAVARDAAGNSTTATNITVTVSNAASPPGDLNGDGHVNVTDLSILLSNYGTTNAVADINKDGIVNILDLSILLSNYGT